MLWDDIVSGTIIWIIIRLISPSIIIQSNLFLLLHYSIPTHQLIRNNSEWWKGSGRAHPSWADHKTRVRGWPWCRQEVCSGRSVIAAAGVKLWVRTAASWLLFFRRLAHEGGRGENRQESREFNKNFTRKFIFIIEKLIPAGTLVISCIFGPNKPSILKS